MTETAVRRRGGLPRWLREETADLHRYVEDAVGLPESVQNRDDYLDLLGRFLGLHGPLEERLAATVWRQSWTEIGIEIGRHRRAHLLADDLRALGAAAAQSRRAHLPPLRTFGEALGCLYVLEGSSLGGRVLAPAIVSVVGDVPVRFLVGDRGQPGPWQDVRAALRRVAPERADEVLLGARETFGVFATHLSGHAPARGEAR